MDSFTFLFWISAVTFFTMSIYLLMCTKRSKTFYIQIAAGAGMFITSKIGRKFLGLE